MQFKPWFSAIIVLIVLSPTCPAMAATLNVPADYPTIQSCIDAAVSGQDECAVAPGTYNELINFLGKAITLRSSHGPQVTTIDGTGLSGSVVTCVSNQTMEATLDGFTITGGVGTMPYERTLGGGVFIKGVYFNGNYPDVVFNLRNAVVTGNDAYYGGGIYVGQENTLAMWDCEVSGNTSHYGGGIFGYLFARIHVEGAHFRGNFAELDGGAVCGERATFDAAHSDFVYNLAGVNGGAVAIEGYLSSTSTESEVDQLPLGHSRRHPTYASVRQCRFESNTALGQSSNLYDPSGGGAIFSESDSFEVVGSTFSKNTGRTGGAILNWCCPGRISDCLFADNEAYEDGGGIYNCEIASSSLFLRNRAAGDGGGAFMCSVQNSIFKYNSASRGGGLCHGSADSSSFLGNHASELGGGIHSEVPWGRSMNSQFVGNEANSGGGAFFLPGAPLYNSTFAFNISHGNGGGAVGAIPYNSIFWGNQAGASGHQLWNGDESFVPITSTDLQDSGGSANWNPANGLDQGGNIDLDPQFVRPPDDGGDGWGDQPLTLNFDESANDDFGDLRLSPGSPCINAGDSNFVASIPLDLDGHARVLCGQVDMGAYEFGIGDFDCDQMINLADLSAWPDCITAPGISFAAACEAFDFNGDVDVDLLDFAAWQNLLGD